MELFWDTLTTKFFTAFTVICMSDNTEVIANQARERYDDNESKWEAEKRESWNSDLVGRLCPWDLDSQMSHSISIKLWMIITTMIMLSAYQQTQSKVDITGHNRLASTILTTWFGNFSLEQIKRQQKLNRKNLYTFYIKWTIDTFLVCLTVYNFNTGVVSSVCGLWVNRAATNIWFIFIWLTLIEYTVYIIDTGVVSSVCGPMRRHRILIGHDRPWARSEHWHLPLKSAIINS